MKKEDIQSKIIEMQVIENKLKQLDQQLNLVDQQLVEDTKLESNLKDLEDKPKSEAIFPLGGGIFARGSLDKPDKVLVSVGSGILIEKSIKDGLKTLDKRKNRLVEAKEELGNHVKKLLNSMGELEKTIRS